MNVTQRIKKAQRNGNYRLASFLESRPRCQLCGAIISENNPDGYGYSCREKLEEATSLSFRNSTNWEEKNPFFDMEVRYHLEWIDNYLKEHKIRNEFYKSFIPSVLEQYNTKGYLSKKQKEIVYKFVFEKLTGYMNPYAEDEYKEWLKPIRMKQKEFINVYWKTSHWDEIRELALKLIFAKKGKTDLSDEVEVEEK